MRDTATMETIGQRIRLRRKELGLSQGDLARMIGIRQPSLCELEKGESKMPSGEVLMNLAKHLKCSQAWIMYGREGEVETLDDDEQKLIANLRKLKLEQQRAIYEFVRATIDKGAT